MSTLTLYSVNKPGSTPVHLNKQSIFSLRVEVDEDALSKHFNRGSSQIDQLRTDVFSLILVVNEIHLYEIMVDTKAGVTDNRNGSKKQLKMIDSIDIIQSAIQDWFTDENSKSVIILPAKGRVASSINFS